MNHWWRTRQFAAQCAVAGYLARHPWESVREISFATGVRRYRVRAALRRMEEARTVAWRLAAEVRPDARDSFSVAERFCHVYAMRVAR